jgi:hypothetical protein
VTYIQTTRVSQAYSTFVLTHPHEADAPDAQAGSRRHRDTSVTHWHYKFEPARHTCAAVISLSEAQPHSC